MNTNPDFEWYQSISSRIGTTPRCPFATIQRCPRYYQSLSLLGQIGTNTSIDPRTDRRLQKKWKKTDFWPKVSEQETAIYSGSGGPRGYNHFCPEIIYDNFGYFAEYVHEFVDEIDRESAHRRLKSQKIEKNDWQWHYMSLIPMHFTACPLYSLLQTYQTQHEDILEIKPNFNGIGINLNALYHRLFRK